MTADTDMMHWKMQLACSAATCPLYMMTAHNELNQNYSFDFLQQDSVSKTRGLL